MAIFRGKGSMSQVPLIATFNEKQVLRNAKGEMTGVYLEVQVDESNLSELDVMQGKAQISPWLDTHKSKAGPYLHDVFYNAEQAKALSKVGSMYHYDDTANGNKKYVMMFSADVRYRDKDDFSHAVVAFPDGTGNVRPPSVSPNAMDVVEARGYRALGMDKARPGYPKPETMAMQQHVHELRKYLLSEDFLKDNIAGVSEIRDINASVPDTDEAKAVKSDAAKALDRMLGRDGRLYPMDYSILTDMDKMRDECAQHDGFFEVDKNGHVLVTEFDPEEPVTPEETLADALHHYAMGNRMGKKSELVWYDKDSTQNINEQIFPEKLPAEQYKTWADSMKAFQDVMRSKMEPEARPAKSNDLRIEPHVDLLVTWSPKDVVHGPRGVLNGAMVEVQVDQSQLTESDIAKGKGHANPSITAVYGGGKSGKRYMSQPMLDSIKAAGYSATSGDKYALAFNANVCTVPGDNGKLRSFVCLPKDESKAESEWEREKIRWYNEQNTVGPPSYGEFRNSDLAAHIRNTAAAKAAGKVDDDLAKAFGQDSLDVGPVAEDEDTFR